MEIAAPVPLVVTEARLRTGSVVDVHCSDGRITALPPAGDLTVPPGAVVVPADGDLVTEPSRPRRSMNSSLLLRPGDPFRLLR